MWIVFLFFIFPLLSFSAEAPIPAECNPIFFDKTYEITTTETGCFFSEVMQEWVPVAVTFPGGYGKKIRKNVPYAIFLHGRGGSERQFSEMNGDVSFRQYEEGGGSPYVVIAPRDTKDCYWKDGANNQCKSFQMITNDLIGWIEKMPTMAKDDKYSRAIFGISKGAHGALHNFFCRPDLFGQVYAMSPIFRPDDDKFLVEGDRASFGTGARFEEQDPLFCLEKLVESKALSEICHRMHIEISPEDKLMAELKRTKTAIGILEEMCPGHVDNSLPGGHSAEFWKPAMARAMNYLGRGFGKVIHPCDEGDPIKLFEFLHLMEIEPALQYLIHPDLKKQ